MKTMKIWRIAFAMLAAFSLASCSSDDDEVFQAEQLTGTWEQVYDKGVVAEGYVQYTFTPGMPATVGECTIHVYDVFAGQHDGTSMEMQEYDVQRLSAKDMTWHLSGSDVVLNFKKVK